jgi:fumarate reductase flavoprotein subunit
MAFINGTFGMSVRYPRDIDAMQTGEPLLMLPIYKGAIAVNLHARRFADESISYKTLGEICLSQPESTAFQIFDQKIMDKSTPTPTAQDVKGAYAKGWIHKADTIEGLARAVHIDSNVLARTIAAYNEGAARGSEEEFGRASLGKGYGRIAAIDTPPFYIFPCTTSVLSTYCGVRVGADMQVIDVWGKPIEGLFAAGEIVGGFHGAGYMSGSALAKAAIFGHIAAESAAARAATRTR